MGDLTELYSNLLSQAADPMRGYRAMQEQEVRNMELLDKRRQFEAEQQLRELFQRNANPNASEIGAISPQFAQQYSRSQFDMMRQQVDMQNIASQMEERQRKQLYEESKIRAHAFAPIAEQYKRNVTTMGEQQARAKYNADMGFAIASLEDSGIKMPQNFNPKKATPEAILNTAIGFDYKSPYMEQKAAIEKEAGIRQLPQSVMTPQGPMLQPGIPKQDEQTLEPADVVPGSLSEALTDADIQMMQQQFQSLPNGSPEKVRIGAMLADAVKQRLPSGQFITPEQRQQREAEGKAREVTAAEEAKGEVEKKAEAKDKFALIAALPNDSEVLDLLQKSITGAPEALLKGPVASALHIENQAQTATTVLKSLAQTVKNLATKAKGDLNLQEVKDYDAAMGALANEDLTPMARYAAYTTAVGIVKRKLSAQHPDLAAQYQGNAPKDAIPTPKTIEEAKALPKGTVFRVPETGELRINQ